jgi:hypothetical protein
MKRRDTEGRMPLGHHRINRQPPSLVERTVRRITVDSQGRQLDQWAGDAWNESTKMGGERRLEGGATDPRLALRGPEEAAAAAAQPVRR